MMKIFISDAVVSKGYDGAPAIRFFNSENGGEFAVFQVGNRSAGQTRKARKNAPVRLSIWMTSSIPTVEAARKKGRTAERRMEPDKARSRTTQLGSPSRHPILQLDSLNRRRPLLLRLVPCLKAVRATRVSVAGTIPISQAEYATGRANKI